MTSHATPPSFTATAHAPSWSATGTSPASGVSGVGALSGPYYIQEQSLQYDYVRVPLGNLSSVVLSLSGSTWTGVHTGTVIIGRTRATYSVRKSTEWFETSSFVQPQRFAVEAVSADQFGNTYCGIAPSACILSSLSGTYMVAGQVYTIQPWYKRRPWVTGQDPEDGVHIVKDGYTYQAYNDNGQIPDYQTGAGASDAELVWGDFQATFATDVLDGNAGLTALVHVPMAEKSGTYTYYQDDSRDIMNYTDIIGNAYVFGAIHDQFGAVTQLFQYDSNRHDWS